MKRLPAVLAIAALALTGCQSGSPEPTMDPKPLLSPVESIDHYSAVLDAVEGSLEKAYPDATIGVSDKDTFLSPQNDGECSLVLPQRTVDLSLFMSTMDTSMEALQAALNEHGFGELTDVEQNGPIRSTHTEDARGATFRASQRNSSDFSIRVAVHSETCGPADLPAP